MSNYPNMRSVDLMTMTYRQLAEWTTEMTERQLDMPVIIYDGEYHTGIEILGVCHNSPKEMDSPLEGFKLTQPMLLMELISV